MGAAAPGELDFAPSDLVLAALLLEEAAETAGMDTP